MAEYGEELRVSMVLFWIWKHSLLKQWRIVQSNISALKIENKQSLGQKAYTVVKLKGAPTTYFGSFSMAWRQIPEHHDFLVNGKWITTEATSFPLNKCFIFKSQYFENQFTRKQEIQKNK